MGEALGTYLDDHLTGAKFALELLENLRGGTDSVVAQLAAELLPEIDADRDVLQQIAERVGGGDNPLREAAAWLAEKASRLKLRIGSAAELGTFEALEALSLGILGKRSLWRILGRLAASDQRLSGQDFTALAAAAEEQFGRVEVVRLGVGERALRE